MALGFILHSLWGIPMSVMAFIRMWMHLVFPVPVGPRTMKPCLTACVSYSWTSFRVQEGWLMRPAAFTSWSMAASRSL